MHYLYSVFFTKTVILKVFSYLKMLIFRVYPIFEEITCF